MFNIMSHDSLSILFSLNNYAPLSHIKDLVVRWCSTCFGSYKLVKLSWPWSSPVEFVSRWQVQSSDLSTHCHWFHHKLVRQQFVHHSRLWYVIFQASYLHLGQHLSVEKTRPIIFVARDIFCVNWIRDVLAMRLTSILIHYKWVPSGSSKTLVLVSAIVFRGGIILCHSFVYDCNLQTMAKKNIRVPPNC